MRVVREGGKGDRSWYMTGDKSSNREAAAEIDWIKRKGEPRQRVIFLPRVPHRPYLHSYVCRAGTHAVKFVADTNSLFLPTHTPNTTTDRLHLFHKSLSLSHSFALLYTLTPYRHSVRISYSCIITSVCSSS